MNGNINRLVREQNAADEAIVARRIGAAVRERSHQGGAEAGKEREVKAIFRQWENQWWEQIIHQCTRACHEGQARRDIQGATKTGNQGKP